MTGPEHYRAAEEILEGVDLQGYADRVLPSIAAVQVHATLAQTAATAANGYDKAYDADYRAWDEVALSLSPLGRNT